MTAEIINMEAWGRKAPVSSPANTATMPTVLEALARHPITPDPLPPVGLFRRALMEELDELTRRVERLEGGAP